MTSEQFRSVRQALGLTQTQLADYLGVHPRTVAKYELRERPVPAPVRKLMQLLVGGPR